MHEYEEIDNNEYLRSQGEPLDKGEYFRSLNKIKKDLTKIQEIQNGDDGYHQSLTIPSSDDLALVVEL